MATRALRSRSFRKVKVKTPGSKVTIHYKKKKPSKAHCGMCGAVLPGVLSDREVVMRTTPKSLKRPERPYGGVLCSSCSRSKIKEKVKSL